MNVILTEIKTQRDRLCQDIMEKECLVAALDVVAKHVANGRAPSSIDLGLLLPALTAGARTHELKEVTAPASEPPALPPPPAEYYVHPELKAMDGHGSDTKRVRWAISQMTHDYSVQHLAALLEREGIRLSTAKISVVLSRLKKYNEIEESRPGLGPVPALFRRPNIPRPADFKPLDENLKLPPEPYPTLRKSLSSNPLLAHLIPELG